MNASWVATNAVATLLLPPLNLVLIAAYGLWLRRRRPRLGASLSIGALALLLVLCTKAGALLLVAPLENLTQPLAPAGLPAVQAIVVLGGGRIGGAPEYGGRDSPGLTTLVRLRYAAHLQRTSGLPLLVSGGSPDGAAESEAALMARSLREDFGVPVRWLEPGSDNTAENARYAAQQLRRAGVRRVLLVTDAIHMPRSRSVFIRYGLEVVPAPTVFFSRQRLTALDFFPDGEGLRRSHYALHEWIGLLWYRLRHGA